MGDTPQPAARIGSGEEACRARAATHPIPERHRGRLPKTQTLMGGGGCSPPSSPKRRGANSDGYSTASETPGNRRHRRGRKEKKWLAPVRLDMPVFKSMDPNTEVTYTLWLFDVDTLLDQYEESNMRPYIFSSLRGYHGKWACSLPEGKDIPVQELLEHMEHMFSNVHDYDTMIQSLYEVRQKDSKTMEEYMLHIHKEVAMPCVSQSDPQSRKDLKKDHFYHGLQAGLWDALSFAMAYLPEQEQGSTLFDMLYTLAMRLEAAQPSCIRRNGTGAPEPYKEKFHRYPAPAGLMATLEEDELFLPNPEPQEADDPESELLEGISVQLAQVMNHYQWEEHQCFVCGATDHFAWDCPHCDTFRKWHKEQLNSKGVGQEDKVPTPKKQDCSTEVTAQVAMASHSSPLINTGPTAHWIGMEMLVDLVVEGRESKALAESGSQVNTLSHRLVHQHKLPILPLVDLVDHPLNLVGLGGWHTRLLYPLCAGQGDHQV